MPAGLLHEEKEELMNKKKQSINYLDLIPQRAETLRWHTDEATGLITLEVENTGVFNTIAQKVFHKPRTTQVHLDGDEVGTVDLVTHREYVSDFRTDTKATALLLCALLFILIALTAVTLAAGGNSLNLKRRKHRR